ncbi:hypothetical protein cypCar_00032204, partial [Cyprinus carpio]
LLELESVAIKDRRRLKRVRRSKVLDQNIEMANQTLVNIAREYPLNITELNTLEYAAAAVIADKMRDTPKKARKEPLWKRRLLQKVNQHRRIFTIFNKLKLGVTSRHVNKLINRTLRLARMDYSRLEEFKMKLQQGQFGVQEEDLLKSLTCTTSVTRGEAIQRLHNQQQAEDARDSIAKVAYGRVFGWIVSKINELLAPKVDCDVELNEIGILDIFGFENFAVNRFEQLCINLANEQLQYFFNHHIFLMEQKEYKEEGITWETITYKDNKPI